jgi:hypothetical protein
MTPWTRLDGAVEEFRAAVAEVLTYKYGSSEGQYTIDELALCLGTEEGFTYPFSHRLLAVVNVIHDAHQQNKNVDDRIRQAGIVKCTRNASFKFPGEVQNNG